MEPGRRAAWNQGIEFVRALALFAAVLPHFSPLPPQARGFPLYYSLVEAFASLGVPLFFLLSGYLFRCSLERPFGKMIRRRYLAPWLAASLFYFLFGAATGEFPPSLERLLGIITGYDSIYYFLLLLLAFEAATWILARAGVRTGRLFAVSGFLGLAVSFWTSRLILASPEGVFGVSRFFTYLNPLSFYPYYALGLALSSPRVEAALRGCRVSLAVAALASAGAKCAETFLLVRAGRYGTVYFSATALLMGLSAGAFLVAVFVYPNRAPSGCGRFARLGRYALPVYLYHLAATRLLGVFFSRNGIPMVPYHLAGVFLAVWLTYRFIRLGEKMLPPRLAKAVFGLSRSTGFAPEGLNG